MLRDHIVKCSIAPQDLAPGKTPPLCDSCNEPFAPGEDGMYHVSALVLEDREGASLWGLVCERTIRRYYQNLRVIPEEQARREELRTIHDVLGREMKVVAWGLDRGA